jgi:hypothetical protein
MWCDVFKIYMRTEMLSKCAMWVQYINLFAWAQSMITVSVMCVSKCCIEVVIFADIFMLESSFSAWDDFASFTKDQMWNMWNMCTHVFQLCKMGVICNIENLSNFVNLLNIWGCGMSALNELIPRSWFLTLTTLFFRHELHLLLFVMRHLCIDVSYICRGLHQTASCTY